MADKARKFSNNISGKYYVDDECIDCSLCSEIAPDNFTVDMEAGHDYVYHQPMNQAQEALCLDAMDLCPVDAIGNDGDSPQVMFKK
ncbi:ferredoxin [Deltaproteobacteria bacterium TL4]